MKSKLGQFIERWNVLRFTELVVLVAAIVGYGEYRLYQTNTLLTENQHQFASSTAALDSRVLELYSLLSQLSSQSTSLSDTVQNELAKNETFAAQLGKVNDAVGTLDQLSKTDPKLLEKYSKVYFLNENYVPAQLATIPQENVYNKNSMYQIHFQVWPFLDRMLKAAAAEGKIPQIISAYRSFGTQSSLKAAYKVTYGAGTANKFSADQGYSEHQLGTTLDFTTLTTGDNFTAFDTTAEYTWLLNNAHKYGFILSYPKDNKYYSYEPWHWRFVGIDLATRLHAENKNFYDLDQRDINNYLLLIFK
ncbi:MAG: M15 family metallopeptidase [Patescibacteria group bacterium]